MLRKWSLRQAKTNKKRTDIETNIEIHPACMRQVDSIKRAVQIPPPNPYIEGLHYIWRLGSKS